MALSEDPISILIVDDEPGIRKLLSGYVTKAGFCPLAASSAEEALEVMASGPAQIVIADVELEGTSGLELLGAIKRDHNADVIMITGYVDDHSYEEAISKGASDFVVKPIRYEELVLRVKRVLREKELTRDRDEMMKELRWQAIPDSLTGIYNSRHFYERLEAEIDRSVRYGRHLSLLLLDVDHFKPFNDTYGHLDGDRVLNRIAEIIQSCLRGVDSAYRYGGEEFTAILPETTAEAAARVAERIRREVEAEDFSPGKDSEFRVTVSIGSTQYRPREDLKTFLRRADEAMYLAKGEGRNRVTSL